MAPQGSGAWGTPPPRARPVLVQFCGFSGWDYRRESLLKAGPFPQASFADAWDPGDEVPCQAFRSPWVLGWASRATFHGSQREGPKLLRTLADNGEEPLATPREAHLSMYRAPASASCWSFPHLPIPCLPLQCHPHLHTVQRVWRESGPAQSLSEYSAAAHQQQRAGGTHAAADGVPGNWPSEQAVSWGSGRDQFQAPSLFRGFGPASP